SLRPASAERESSLPALITLLPIHRKRQQHIPWHPTPERITRVDKKRPANDCRPRAIERATFAFHSVDRAKVLDGIEIPNHFAVLRRVGTQMPINRSGEDHTRDNSNRSRLGRAALRSPVTARRRRLPYLLASGDFVGKNTAAN